MATNPLTRRALIDQIPTEEGRAAPAAQPAQGIHSTELGRQVYNTAMALPGAGGVAKAAGTGGLISRVINAGGATANTAGRVTAGMATVPMAQAQEAAQQPSTAPAAPATQPVAGMQPAAPSAVTAKPQDPAQPATGTAQGKPIMSGVFEHGRGQFSDQVGGMGFGSGGGVSVVSGRNEAAAQGLADRSQAESLARVSSMQAQASPAIARPQMPSAPGRTAQQDRERSALISSLTSVIPGAHGITAAQRNGMITLMNNDNAAAQDAQRTQAGLEQTWMREQGENQRSNQRSLIDRARLGMDAQTQGFTNRAAAQQEQLRNTLLDPKASAEQRSTAQRSLAALAGKTAADRLQAVSLPDTVNEMGQVMRGGQALVRTLDDGSVQQVPINASVNQRQVPQAAIEDLRRNPQAAAQFDEIFGQGASKQYLR